MLTIMYRHHEQGRHSEYTWHIGEELPNIQAHTVFGIEADGDEADHIEEMLDGGINRQVARYYGDFARTIYLNLGGETIDED